MLDKEYERIARLVRSGVDTDWMAKPLRNGFSQTHSLSIDGGGDEYTRYNLGVRYATDDGVMKGRSATASRSSSNSPIIRRVCSPSIITPPSRW